MSSHPESGYNGKRLADDVLRVIESLGLRTPVLVGHSIAGEELTAVGAHHSDRIGGLVYLDALSDPTTDWSEYNALQAKLPPLRNPSRPPRGETNPTFQAYLEWQLRANGFTFPPAELHSTFQSLPDGRMSYARTPTTIASIIRAEALKPDYTHIRVPVLAFVPQSRSVQDRAADYVIDTDDARNAVERFWSADLAYAAKFIRELKKGVPDARVIELPHANHYVFLSNQTEVLREMRSFLAKRNARH
jgi:pimeloyl-ACP methyl ester carboxylesterase